MSASVVISQLVSLVDKSTQLDRRFQKLHPTHDQWNTLDELSSKLLDAASKAQREIKALKETRTQRAWKASEQYRSNSQSARGHVFAKGRLPQPAVFRRNILTIFQGPKNSNFDSEDTKFRKESTGRRCVTLRGLSPDGVISWALAYAPTVWAGGSMPSDLFDCLVDDIEPELVQTWPAVITDTLYKLRKDEEHLQGSPEYDRFFTGLALLNSQNRNRH